MQSIAFRYALAPACIGLAMLVYFSPAGVLMMPAGFFVLAILAVGWVGGVGPGLLAAALGAFMMPHLVSNSGSLLGGVFDPARLLTFSVLALVVGLWSTRWRRVAAALRESEQRYARVVNASNEAFWDWKVAGDELYLSPLFLEMFDFPPDTVFAGRAEFFERWPLVPEDRGALEHAIAEHFAGKTEKMEFAFRVLVRGEIRWIQSTGRAIRDSKGQVARWTGAIQDVTARKCAEEAMRESERRFSLAVAASYNGIWDINFVARTVFFSARTRELCGLEPGPEVVPLDGWFEALPLHPEDRPRRNAALEAHLAGRAPTYEAEVRLRQLDGVYRWRHIHGLCVRDADGKPLWMAGSIGDIDARRQAEEALRESEKRYERAMHASDDGFWDWIPADDEIYVSPRWREIYGFAPDASFTGRDDLISRIPFHPEDRAYLIRVFNEHFAGKTARYKAEARFFRDGKTRWVQLAGLAQRDQSGEVLHWTGTVRDITEGKRAEEALRESERRYELAMAASESGYWDWDIPTDRYFVSPRAYELAGFPPGTTWVDGDEYKAHLNMHPADFAKWENAREELFAGTGDRLAMEVRYIINGETRWHSLQAICRRDDTGKVIRWTGSATDVTERKLAEAGLEEMGPKLRQAQRLEAMGTLAGGIAHDFNNILGAILGYGEMALRDVPAGTRLRRDLESILTAGERGRALVERVLTFSRSGVVARTPIHVEKVVREALDLLTAGLPADIKIEATLAAGRAAMLGESTQVHQVVMNLATNGIQAMPKGGSLRVSLRTVNFDAERVAAVGTIAAGDYIVLEVTDTGVGIPSANLDRIFEPFFTTKEVNVGNGLGLSLVHGIVTDVGGAIDVVSTRGSGSSFTVYFPRIGDVSDASSANAEQSSPVGNGQRILVVDDEEPLVRLTTERLENLGYRPTGFSSGATALDAFRADPDGFDVVITDERMPDVSGSTLIREVRRTRRSIPILLVSGYVGGMVSHRAYNEGADEVLNKPLSERDLATALARVLQR